MGNFLLKDCRKLTSPNLPCPMTSERLICLAMDLWTRSGSPDPDPEQVLSSSMSLMVVAWRVLKS